MSSDERRYTLFQEACEWVEFQEGTRMAFVFNRRYDEATEVRLMAFFATLSEKDRRRYVLR